MGTKINRQMQDTEGFTDRVVLSLMTELADLTESFSRVTVQIEAIARARNIPLED
jgi:hypothetical protein